MKPIPPTTTLIPPTHNRYGCHHTNPRPRSLDHHRIQTDGNTIKVTVPSAATVSKSVTEKVSGIHPGDTVTAIGTTSNGVVKAATVRVGETSFPGGFGSRFGQGGTNGGAPPAP